ncbi:MAG: tagaturonate reductase [Muribaculaceae bacterium]|nr:tagaturonate reductase [Muribaculaceae bacterium]
MIKQLNNSAVERVHRVVKILQFGEGNFLRAFADWILDVANEKGVIDMGVAIVKPRQGKSVVVENMRKQDNLYHVVLEGISAGVPTVETRLITVVEDAFTPDDSTSYEKYILSPDLRFVISNTTEAGIRMDDDDVLAEIPRTFPGKITNLLWRRWNYFRGDGSKGLFMICCELIEDNGCRLRDCVLRHASKAGLPQEFIEWVERCNWFIDTLVDRIVSGLPEKIGNVQAMLGYGDNCIVKGELYHQWVIGGDGACRLREELPLHRAGLNVHFAESVKEFRDKKVRVLNGSHTGMVAMGLLSGCETVAEAFDNENISRFINGMVANEVLPTLGGDRGALRSFALSILERFRNPYIRHKLESIALNSLSKWEARNFDTVKDFMANFGRIAGHEVFTFACLLALYAPDSGFEPQDNPGHVALIRSMWNDENPEGTVRAIVCRSGIFIRDFEKEVPGFCALAARYLREIRFQGIEKALHHFLTQEL